MGQKGTGRRLSDQERMEIIAKLEGDKPRASAAECARQYGVSSAAITKLMKMKDKIKQRFNENNTFSQQRKRGGTERHTAFEDELFQWINQQQQEQAAAAAAVISSATQLHSDQLPVAVPMAPLTSTKVQEKAQELLKVHDLGAFRASKGWYYRFCRRYGLSRTSLSPDDGEREGDDDHGIEPSGSESEGSGGGGDNSGDGADGANGSRKQKRKEGSVGGARKKAKSQGWAVQSLQETLVKAAVALDHPEARQYLGEPAAGEMLRSIQQSIGVVQCIRLKKTTPEASDAEPPSTDETALSAIDEGETDHAVAAAADVDIDTDAANPGPMEDVIV